MRTDQQPRQGLSIGELAERTDLGTQTIRAWEQRHGFPEPLRTDSGHRRYDVRDVERVARVLELKNSGLRLDEAIRRVRQDAALEQTPSIYAELRRVHPQLHPQRLSRSTLVALSHAIEDEAMARGGRALVFGAFQKGSFYRHSRARWQELNRTATLCVTFAAFGETAYESGDPLRVELPDDAPMLREWAVVVYSPDLSAVLTAWEVPGQRDDGTEARVFEAMWSLDPTAVRTAAETCLAAARIGGVADTSVDLDSYAPSPLAPGAADALCLRAFARLDLDPKDRP
ncbi:hypothetical protein GCM10027425_26370 [Alteromonas gracilis]